MAAHFPPMQTQKKVPDCRLFYQALCPHSRKVRLILGEKGIACAFTEERPFTPSRTLYDVHHEGSVPLLQDRGHTLVRIYAIQEYLEATYPITCLLGKTVMEKAESRRLSSWFDVRFSREITTPLLEQKVFKRAKGRGDPDSDVLRAARHALHHHLDYIGWLADRRNWLAGAQLTLADLTAAAHLSCIDYLGDVPWQRYGSAKDWYMRIKSRPSFRPLLMESFAGIIPPRHYRVLDF